MNRLAFVDGDWIPEATGLLPVGTQGLHYGTAAFEGIRTYPTETGRATILFLYAHLERLLRSCSYLQIELGYSVDELARIAHELVDRNDGHTAAGYIRPVVFKTRLLPGTAFGVRLTGVGHAVAMTWTPMPRRNGAESSLWQASACVIPTQSISAEAKLSGKYIVNALAVDEAVRNGHSDGLLCNRDGHVVEASTSNVFIVSDGVLVTPPLSDGPLPGVTRAAVLTIAAERGIPVVERSMTVDDVCAAQEVFLCGTGVEISPVLRACGQQIGTGQVGQTTKEIIDAYEDLIACGAG
ncbi:MAG: aminotransferase class IV [Propionibacteriaceae bacterium]|nr:aminotransferase class IV [Propionibacteriaceae bacterium]